MNTLDKDYLDLMKKILETGNVKESRAGQTKSIFGTDITHDMRNGFPLLTTKKMHFNGIMAELLFFLSGSTNIKYMVDNGCNIWVGDALKAYNKHEDKELEIFMKKNPGVLVDFQHTQRSEFIKQLKEDSDFCKKWGNLGPVYGKQWRKWERYGFRNVHNTELKYGQITYKEYVKRKHIDQLQNLINTLRTNPDDRRMIVSAWNVADLDAMILPACHTGFQVYTRELTVKEREYAYVKMRTPKDPSVRCGPIGVPDHPDPEFNHKIYDQANIPRRAISLIWSQRSCDVPLGIPYNIASYGLLLQILGKIVNMVPEQLKGNLGDTHIYTNQINEIQEQFTKEPFDLPIVELSNELDWQNTDFDELLEIIMKDPTKHIQLKNYQSHNAIKITLSN